MHALVRSFAQPALFFAFLSVPVAARAEAPAKPAKKEAVAKKPASGKATNVVVKTSMGDITLELDAGKAPISVENFLKYVDKKHYDGTIFHRVINGFMIQGGGFEKSKKEKATDAPIKNEAANGLKNVTGTVAMARTSIPDSATAQFYINVADNGSLDFRDPSPGGIGYAVFGKVVKGMDVVEKIKAVPTSNEGGAFQNAPTTPVVIESVRRAK